MKEIVYYVLGVVTGTVLWLLTAEWENPNDAVPPNDPTGDSSGDASQSESEPPDR